MLSTPDETDRTLRFRERFWLMGIAVMYSFAAVLTVGSLFVSTWFAGALVLWAELSVLLGTALFVPFFLARSKRRAGA